jgi:uncharacterized protein (DUF433 family)
MATTTKSVIIQDPEIHSGEPVFRGTRVPFQTLLDYLEGGETLDEFLKQYPGVAREQAIASLEEAKALVLARFGK